MSNASGTSLDISVSDVVSFLRIEGGFSEALGSVVRRRLLLKAADDAGIQASAAEVQRAVDAYRAIHGLHKASDTQAWMKNNGITADVLEKHLEENVRISKTRDHLAATCAPDIAESAAAKTLIRELAVEDWIARQLAS